MAAMDEEAIRRRAYELSQEDGGSSPDDNWRRAEEELRNASTKTAGRKPAAAKKPAAKKPAAKKSTKGGT
jgi:hypothetical protein